MPAKRRSSIPADVAAKVLFLADRTCSVCRRPGKSVQIHHLDEDPSNHDSANLAVLCLECHRDTQLRGGFDRKLDSDQVRLYRDDWYRQVAISRTAGIGDDIAQSPVTTEGVAVATSVAEALREAGEYELLATHYASLGNQELRDKYIELTLSDKANDHTVVHLRAYLQGRPDLVPPEVAEREMAYYTELGDWNQRARLQRALGYPVAAAYDYVQGIAQSVAEDRPFAAAYYLKELVREGCIDALLEEAFRRSSDRGDLWWQVRALQELGWKKELHALVQDHREEIVALDIPALLRILAEADGDGKGRAEASIRSRGGERMSGRFVAVPWKMAADDEEPG